MTQATRIPGPPSDNQTLHKPPPNNALNRFDSRGRLNREGFSLPEWLTRFARSLGGTLKAHFETIKNRLAYSPVPPPPDRRAAQEPEPDDAPDGFDWLGWLKHFVLYLCAVTVICLIGLYFLWKIPFLRDPSQLLVMMDESHAPRPTTATAPPATPTSTVRAAPSPPPVTTAAAPSPPPVTTAAAPSPPPVTTAAAPSPPSASIPTTPGQPPVTTATVVATTSPAAPPTAEPAGTQPSLEPQPATVPASQVTPATPPAEPAAEAVPPPPTPQVEIEKLLTDAQQQMDNRRFTAPTSGNALSTYRRVLELQPNHPAALEGIQRITTYYQDIAQQSLQQGRLDESLAYINRGLRATPKNETLLSLRRQVQQAQKAARQQREREEQQRQAALEEMQRQQLEQIRREQLRLQQEQQQPWWRQPPTPNESGGFNQR
jgi:hypothetical protein